MVNMKRLLLYQTKMSKLNAISLGSAGNIIYDTAIDSCSFKKGFEALKIKNEILPRRI